jgi:hypothetical protein
MAFESEITIVAMAGPVTDERAGALLQRYRERFGGQDLPVPVESIAEDLLGLSVEEIELQVSGLLLPAEKRIFANAGEPAPRRRFTLAHEIGHWVCQCLEGRSAAMIYCRAQDVTLDVTDRAFEREANVFAAELLMPETTLRSSFAQRPDLADLATRFDVSTVAMQWRLYNFGLVTEPPA